MLALLACLHASKHATNSLHAPRAWAVGHGMRGSTPRWAAAPCCTSNRTTSSCPALPGVPSTPLCPPALHTTLPTCPPHHSLNLPSPQVFNPKNKLQQAFVITLGRAGEDNRSFRLTDIDSTLAGFAGADYDMLVRGGGGLLVQSILLVVGNSTCQ